ncbi:hypothetical protein [Sphingobacterium sp. SGL-16]|uniref:hypothetical protein n=1 Tax=Sphingobacterium sp. SGL-16 TaxID=2710883 RepID=UPI0013EAC384|nr:hypothetical protein [Sphingobacterium sp. SGL-16]NGM74216.1 hypothetical protein [Sphingobacterium sp. SGL-16]
MNNFALKYLIFLYVFFAHLPVSNAQMQYSVWSNNYIFLSSYLGYQSPERFTTVQFSFDSTPYSQSEWSLSVRLLNSIKLESGTNRSGKDFPAEKINLRWTGDNNDRYMRLPSIGATLEPLVLPASGEIFLINRSRTPLNTDGRTSALYQLYSQMTIAQGRYLEDYLSPDPYTHVTYRFQLLYTLYDNQNRIIGTQIVNHSLQMPPNLTDGHLIDVEPDFSIAVNPRMDEVNLSFKNLTDYKQGVSVQIPSAITVHANTDFEIRVKAVESDMISQGGHVLPLSIIKVSLQNETNSTGTTTPVTLSNSEKVVLRGNSKDKNIKRYTGVKYEVNIPNNILKNLTLGTYSVSILYQLMPL